ncbi:MAG: SPFH/Band 7/PHB domain protein [Bacillales bacterium]|nr:SPFH/Band 7/PHB domain protein [Bacillales bacterium]
MESWEIAILVISIVVFIFLIIFVSRIRIIKQTEKGIVERLGAYNKTWNTGIHVLVPFVDSLAQRISMKEQVKDFAPQPVITKDNVTMQIDTVVFYQVTDPKLYAYGVENPMMAIENLSATTLRNIIGELDLDSTLTSRDLINARMRAILDEATDAWGIKVNRVEVKNILPPKDIRESMERQMRAEREKREKILLAEGEKQSAILLAQGKKESMILNADGEKQAAILQAEGRAASILKIKEAEAEGLRMIKESAPDAAVLTLKSYEALTKVADGQATKIIIPSDIQNVASLATSVAEIVKEKKQ